MKFLKYIIILLLISSAGISFCELSSQAATQKPTRQTAMEAFSKRDFENAYNQFGELLKIYSKDPLYRYYSAVCLVNLERDPEEAVILMQQALESNTSARPLPSEAFFYLGRAMHLAGMYSEAIDSYTRYSDQAGKKATREKGVPELIQQCIRESGALEKNIKKPAEELKKEVLPVTYTAVTETVDPYKQTALPAKEALPAEYSALLDEALAFQYLADSVYNLVSEQKQLLEKLPDDKKQAGRSKIAEYEILAASYQKSADQKYATAYSAMNPGDPGPENDKAVQISDNDIIEINDVSLDTLKKIITPAPDTVDIFYYFEILEKTVTEPGEKIQINPAIPEGLVYRIQVAVFRNPVSPVFFKGITPVYGFTAEGSELKTYYAGMFRRISDARNALSAVRGKGFKDSFVTSFMGNRPVSADRAAILEKEWGMKPFERKVNEVPVIVPADTLPPTLIFRVEAMRVSKPAKADAVDVLRTLSGNRGLDIVTLEDKKIAYLIGNFITFDSAAEYADLIVRNGYREARVVAWLGTKEIPVETAKQLFENLK
jgi:tetratricopeptide (TPR) repeat protein